MVGSVVERAGKPALAGGAAAAAIAGSVALGKALKPKRRKVNLGPVSLPKIGADSLRKIGSDNLPKLGSVSLPNVRIKTPKVMDVDWVGSSLITVGQQVGRTGEQLCKVCTDVQRAGETTERVGKLLSK